MIPESTYYCRLCRADHPRLVHTPRHLAEHQTITTRTFEAHLRLRHVDLIPCPAREIASTCFICDRVPAGKHRAEVA